MLDALVDKVISEQITLITKERFNMILRHRNIITSLDGDVVECGVWKGGMSIFLTHAFPLKTMWFIDSFAGFQNPTEGKYQYKNEVHLHGGLATEYSSVIENFKNHQAYLPDRVNIVRGYVKDVLPTLPIHKISLLRIDVDAYSATLEVLDELYSKVVPGGYIIFDDICLQTSLDAIKDFYSREQLPLILYDTTTDALITDDSYPCGSYTKIS